MTGLCPKKRPVRDAGIGGRSANAEPGAAVAGGPPVKKETDDRLSRHRREAMMA
jgi:hypothetical protein